MSLRISSSRFCSFNFFLRIYSPNPPNDDSPYSSPALSASMLTVLCLYHSHHCQVDVLMLVWRHLQSECRVCGTYSAPMSWVDHDARIYELIDAEIKTFCTTQFLTMRLQLTMNYHY